MLLKALVWWFSSGIGLVFTSNRLCLNHTFDFLESPVNYENVAHFTCLQEAWVVNTLPSYNETRKDVHSYFWPHRHHTDVMWYQFRLWNHTQSYSNLTQQINRGLNGGLSGALGVHSFIFLEMDKRILT